MCNCIESEATHFGIEIIKYPPRYKGQSYLDEHGGAHIQVLRN